MFAKFMMGAAAVLAAALFAYLGHGLIEAFGTARYEAGLAEGRLQQMPLILAANASAAKAGLQARDRIIAAEAVHRDETARLATLAEQSENEVKTYEASNAGAAGCLDAGRVRAIQAMRATFFHPPASTEANARDFRAMSDGATQGADGR